ncbi:DUF4229 domain-containing protein [Microbacter sp. GSS18]|nr:DUF4229 domain-containing protein [Microbacter sp. GSS18]
MKARPVLVYSALRLLAFLVPFGLLMLLPIGRELYWLSAIFAALIGLSLSMLFLRRPLDEVTAGMAERREAARAARRDEDDEDAAADALESDAQTATADSAPAEERRDDS